jgi:phosphoglycolate phosphatase
MKLALILLDFDGTIADTFCETVRIFNHFADKYGYRKMQDDELASARQMNHWELLKYLRVPKHKLPFLIRRGRSMLQHHLDRIEVFPGVRELLELASEHGVPCGIVTSNSTKNVERFIQIHRLPNLHFVRSSSRLLGKPREFKRVMRKRKVNKESILYIGDETRDIDAAHESGIRIASVGWGYNRKEALQMHRPDYLVMDPEELLNTIRPLLPDLPC